MSASVDNALMKKEIRAVFLNKVLPGFLTCLWTSLNENNVITERVRSLYYKIAARKLRFGFVCLLLHRSAYQADVPYYEILYNANAKPRRMKESASHPHPALSPGA